MNEYGHKLKIDAHEIQTITFIMIITITPYWLHQLLAVSIWYTTSFDGKDFTDAFNSNLLHYLKTLMKKKRKFTSNDAINEISVPIFSYIPRVESKLAVASSFPEGHHSHCLTVRVCAESRTAYAITMSTHIINYVMATPETHKSLSPHLNPKS